MSLVVEWLKERWRWLVVGVATGLFGFLVTLTVMSPILKASGLYLTISTFPPVPRATDEKVSKSLRGSQLGSYASCCDSSTSRQMCPHGRGITKSMKAHLVSLCSPHAAKGRCFWYSNSTPACVRKVATSSSLRFVSAFGSSEW